jgi:hypothetical protein
VLALPAEKANRKAEALQKNNNIYYFLKEVQLYDLRFWLASTAQSNRKAGCVCAGALKVSIVHCFCWPAQHKPIVKLAASAQAR